MSMMRRRRLPAFRPASADPKLCAQRFGELIRHFRELDGRPIEELAPWAGVTREGWEAIEAGQAEVSLEHVLLMAAVLHLGDSCLVPLLSYAAGAQEH
jgi:DNA-binding XRE family transcriptional regulator